MAMSARVGSFLTTTGAAGNQITVSGLGFQPDVVFFFWDGSTGTPPSAGQTGSQQGFGWALSSTDRRAMSVASNNGQATSDTYSAQRDDSCVVINSQANNTRDGSLDLNAFNSDGFVLVIDDQFTQSYRINYLALGGDEIENAVSGTLLTNAATGAQSVTGMAFQPDFLLAMTIRSATAINTHQNVAVLSIGAAIGANQFTVMSQDANGQAAGTAHSYMQDAEILAGTSSGVTAITNRVSFTSFNADGFTLNIVEQNSQMQVFYLAMRGMRAAITTPQTRTDTNNISVTGVGVGTPIAALFFSTNNVESTLDTSVNNATMSIGAASGPSQRAAIAVLSVHGADPTQQGKAIRDDAVYARINPTGFAINALMDLVSFDSDGMTLVMDDTDSAAADVKAIVFGQEATQPVIATITSPLVPGSTMTITGSGFGATQGNGSVLINGVAQTILTWADTQITFTCILGNNRYDTPYTVTVEEDGGNQDEEQHLAGYTPATGAAYVELADPLASASVRLTSGGDGDLEAGDQVEWSSVLSGIVEQDVSNVTIYDDGSFAVEPTITAFTFRVHDGEEWGAFGLQSMVLDIPVPEAPVITKAISCDS